MKAILGGVAVVLWAGAAMAADPVEGVWQTRADDNGNYRREDKANRPLYLREYCCG